MSSSGEDMRPTWIPGTLIAGALEAGAGTSYHSFNPVTGRSFGPAFGDSSAEQLDRACHLAATVFDAYRAAPLNVRAKLLEQVGQELLALGDELIETASAETGLPLIRLEGERTRTVHQLRMFAGVVRCGDFQDYCFDESLPERKPQPRPELRLRRIPLGPIAVFGASNFPLAFSVAGGDTAAALAAGCPVIVKAHPSHPATSQLAGLAIQRAVAASGLPSGIFALLHGHEIILSQQLVQHPAIAGVGFTGSRQAGLALCALAAARAVPVPVFAEMSSTNPVFLLPAALSARGEQIAADFIDSMTLGSGQFCTQPGLVFAVEGPDLDSFLAAAAARLATKQAAAMLNARIHDAYRCGLEGYMQNPSLLQEAEGQSGPSMSLASHPMLFSVSYKDFRQQPSLSAELFGPVSLIVRCATTEQMREAAQRLEGQLTATLHMDARDVPLAKTFLPILERKAGRILANGFPTGVEVASCMMHGGPFPATSDSRFTSVGNRAIERFLRPVCYQNLPAAMLDMGEQTESAIQMK